MNRATRMKTASVSLITAAAIGISGVSTAHASERPEVATSSSALPVDDRTVDRVLSILDSLDENATPEQIAHAFFPDDPQARAEVLGTQASEPTGTVVRAGEVQQAWPLAVARLAIKYGPTVIKGAIKAAKNGAGAVKAYLKTTKLARDPSEMQAVINTIMQFFGSPTAPSAARV